MDLNFRSYPDAEADSMIFALAAFTTVVEIKLQLTFATRWQTVNARSSSHSYHYPS
jgi:hypothetical protein